jgi:predicted RNase H-like nuclease (RuvC/YqgF family)
MDFFIWFLFLVLGVAAGSGGTAYFLRNKEKQESEQTKNGFEEQINALNNQIRDLKAKMESIRDEGKRYWDELQLEKKLRQETEEKVKVIPGLESRLHDKEEQVAALVRENDELKISLETAVRELAEERKSFQESLIYVQGNHYLPAGVVRNLMRQQEEKRGEGSST